MKEEKEEKVEEIIIEETPVEAQAEVEVEESEEEEEEAL